MLPAGVIVRPSAYSVKETLDRIQQFLVSHGVTVYARINQQTEVQTAGLELRPLEFILFGHPKAGGPIMVSNPLAALDLPLKVVAWEDGEHKVWAAYNDAAYIRERYALPAAVTGPLDLEPLLSKAL